MDSKYLELENRTKGFSLSVRNFCYSCKNEFINQEYIKQLIRSAGSVSANYIEANDSLGNKDKKMKIRISKKEAKEAAYWLSHISTYNDINIENKKNILIKEANELVLNFASIIRKLDD